MSDAELRQWAKNGTLQEAKEAIAQIARERNAAAVKEEKEGENDPG